MANAEIEKPKKDTVKAYWKAKDKNSKITRETETQEERFRRLMSVRGNKVQKALDHLKNLSGPGYKYNADQVAIVREMIETKMDAVFGKFGADTEEETTIDL